MGGRRQAVLSINMHSKVDTDGDGFVPMIYNMNCERSPHGLGLRIELDADLSQRRWDRET
jgi:hypothetical protein